MIWEDRSYDPLWEIYSLKTNSWKKLDFDMRNCYYYDVLRAMGVYTDGLFHWWAKSETKNIGENLLSFDFSTEMLIKTPMPIDIDDDRYTLRNLVNLDGSIALISNYLEEEAFDISILGKIGVRESWTKIIVGSLPFVGYPIGVGKSNNVVILNEDGEDLFFLDYVSVWVDSSTPLFGKLHVNGDQLGSCQMGRYKKSFDPIGTINS